jgi:regulator of sigma D
MIEFYRGNRLFYYATFISAYEEKDEIFAIIDMECEEIVTVFYRGHFELYGRILALCIPIIICF